MTGECRSTEQGRSEDFDRIMKIMRGSYNAISTFPSLPRRSHIFSRLSVVVDGH